MILGSFGIINSIEVTANPLRISTVSLRIPTIVQSNSTITAKLKSWELDDEKKGVWQESDAKQSGVEITFETSLGHLIYNPGETKGNGRIIVQSDKGKAIVQLVPDKKSGIATVTASSKCFISGKVQVEVKKDL